MTVSELVYGFLIVHRKVIIFPIELVYGKLIKTTTVSGCTPQNTKPTKNAQISPLFHAKRANFLG